MMRPTKILPLFLLLALAPVGCADDDAEAGGDTTVATTDPDAGTDTGPAADEGTGAATDSTAAPLDVDALYACVEPELLIGAAFAGPGYDPEIGLTGTPQDTYVAHTTQVMVRPEAQADFDMAVGQIIAQLAGAEGLVGYSLALEPTCGFARTLGVWESEEAMYAFVGTGAHAVAMSQTAVLTVTGRTTHWEISSEEIPLGWDVAVAQIDAIEPFVYD